jgi:hypothetical protein
MKYYLSILIVFAMNLLHGQSIQSPSGKIDVHFQLSANGQPTYYVNYKDKAVILESNLGIKLKGKPALDSNFEIIGSKSVTCNYSKSLQ